MDATVIQKAKQWINSNIDSEAKDDIQTLLDAEDQTELVDSFYKRMRSRAE